MKMKKEIEPWFENKTDKYRPKKKSRKFLKDKKGNKLTGKEFMSRWKDGIQSVTPLQQAKVQVRSTMLILMGILTGIIISIIKIRTMWWILIILIGVFGVTSIQFLGLLQKKRLLENIEIQMKGGEDEKEKEK
jgi:hypothetical protein